MLSYHKNTIFWWDISPCWTDCLHIHSVCGYGHELNIIITDFQWECADLEKTTVQIISLLLSRFFILPTSWSNTYGKPSSLNWHIFIWAEETHQSKLFLVVWRTQGNIWKNFTLVRRSDCYHLCCKFFIKVSCICFRCNLWLEWRYKLRKEKERIHLQVLAVLFETSRIWQL